MLALKTLEEVLNQLLNISKIQDYAPNGLQIEGNQNVKRIVTGVSACQGLIDEAIRLKADAILVHHGYFWKGEAPHLKGMKKVRIKSLLMNDISLFAYHLPLDVHSELGNNVCLAKLWGIEPYEALDKYAHPSLVLNGEFSSAMPVQDVSDLIEKTLVRKPFHVGDTAPMLIKKVAWCSGAAQDYLELAAEQGMDAFITGEVSERTIHIAREMGIHFFAAGHHATERYGVQALGNWLATHYDLIVDFVDIDNPI